MSKTVVSINGADIPSANGNPNPDLIAMLERLLGEARSGAMTGIAYCGTASDGCVTNAWVHDPGDAHRLSTGIMILQFDFANAWRRA